MGYYIGFNNFRAFLNKYNYSLSAYNLDVDAETRFESSTFYTVRVEMVGNEITVFVDDVEILSYYDNDLIATGRIGFYTEGAEVVYRNLKITTPCPPTSSSHFHQKRHAIACRFCQGWVTNSFEK
jgi:hypothetical protein